MRRWSAAVLSTASVLIAIILLGLFPFAISTWGKPGGDDHESQTAPAASTSITYNDDVRPILAENCFACHGPDSASREAGLRLDQRDAAIEMAAIVPGEPDSSELVDRISRGQDDDLAMPPIDGHKRLSADQRTILVEWIRQGAVYQPHWSLIPPTRPDLPQVAGADWIRNPIDRFVLARLEANGLQPAPEADRRTLARRLSLDLTGLPPTPQAVEAFVNDSTPEYYQRYVDSLLDSARWGEHRGRFWLDYARYADTHGIHFDNYREIWAYRDWVIDALNSNMPFDQFTIEQLAGDLLPDPSLDQLVATGFNRCNITTNEGGIIDEEYKVLYARDRTETTSAVWLGLTTGCAVCHDHKFDAITMRDFYSFSAFFNNTTQAVRDGNVQDTPPIVPVPRSEDRARWQELPQLISAAKSEMEAARVAARADFDKQLPTMDAAVARQALPADQLIAHMPFSEGAGPAAFLLADGQLQQRIAAADLTWSTPGQTGPASLEISDAATLQIPDLGDFERDNAFSFSAWIWLPQDNFNGSIVARMDEANQHRGWDVWLEGGRLGSHLINRWPENALKVVAGPPLTKERWTHVVVTYDGSSKQEGLRFYADGQELTDRGVQQNGLTESMRTEVPLKIGTRHNSARTTGLRINDLRLFARPLDARECQTLATQSRIAYLLQRPDAIRTPDQRDEIFGYWLRDAAPAFAASEQQHRQLIAEQEAIRNRGTIAHVMNEADGEAEAFLLNRGEYDQRGDRVTAATPEALPPMDPSLPKNRLGLAKWLVSDEHPLTARVTVNRFWQEIFGNGLVGTSGDFGVMGNLPTHPDLLDYLAVEFRESGWDVKQFFRLMVTSATYRQSCAVSEDKLAADPDNHLFSRGPRYRMDAEMIRDHALFSSDLLSTTIGGPSVRPYQPEGVWEAVAMPGSNTRQYVPDSGEGLYRRSMYTFWKRSAPPASMEILNAPNREVCTVKRERTNTPLQALVTLNDPQFIEAARRLAENAIQSSTDDQARIQDIAVRLLARPLQPEELEIANHSLATLKDLYNQAPEQAQALVAVGQTPAVDSIDPQTLAAWTMLCNQLMNLDEVLTK
jgi:mono/diheme cytochrome c family protein